MSMLVKSPGYVDVPAGEYFLGDPCYAVPDALWAPLLDSCGYFSASPVGAVNGAEVLAFSTAYGDGCYKDQFGREHSVDAGMIGLVPMELARDADREQLEELGQFVTFAQPVVAETDGAWLIFGPFMIDTAGPEDEDEEDEEDWDAGDEDGEDWDEDED